MQIANINFSRIALVTIPMIVLLAMINTTTGQRMVLQANPSLVEKPLPLPQQKLINVHASMYGSEFNYLLPLN